MKTTCAFVHIWTFESTDWQKKFKVFVKIPKGKLNEQLQLVNLSQFLVNTLVIKLEWSHETAYFATTKNRKKNKKKYKKSKYAKKHKFFLFFSWNEMSQFS